MVMFKKQRREIANYCNQLERNIDGLERQLATIEERSSHEVIAQLGAIAALQPDQFETDLAPLMAQIFGPIDFAVHRFGRAGSDRLQFHGEGFGQQHRDFSISGELQQLLESGTGMISVLSGIHRSVLADRYLFAEPLVKSDTDDVMGALLVYQLSPEAINENTGTLLHLIGQMLGAAYSRAQSSPYEDCAHYEGACMSSQSSPADPLRSADLAERTDPYALIKFLFLAGGDIVLVGLWFLELIPLAGAIIAPYSCAGADAACLARCGIPAFADHTSWLCCCAVCRPVGGWRHFVAGASGWFFPAGHGSAGGMV